MTVLAATTNIASMLPQTDSRTPLAQSLLHGLYDFFVGWQSQRVLSEMRDDQLSMIGSRRESSGRVSSLA